MEPMQKSGEGEGRSQCATEHLTHEKVDALKDLMEPQEIEVLHMAVDQLEEEATEAQAPSPKSKKGTDGGDRPKSKRKAKPHSSRGQKGKDNPANAGQADREPGGPDDGQQSSSGSPGEEAGAAAAVLRKISIAELPEEALQLIEKEEGSPPQVGAAAKYRGKGPSRWQVTTAVGIWRITKSRSGWSITGEKQSDPAAS